MALSLAVAAGTESIRDGPLRRKIQSDIADNSEHQSFHRRLYESSTRSRSESKSAKMSKKASPTMEPTTIQSSKLVLTMAHPTTSTQLGIAHPSTIDPSTIYPKTTNITYTTHQIDDPANIRDSLPTSTPIKAPTDIPTFSCASDERNFTFSITTDYYSNETEFFLYDDSFMIGSWDFASSERFEEYIFDYCLPIGRNYTLELTDTFGDGICCDAGYGTYYFAADDTVLFDSNANETFYFNITFIFTIDEKDATLLETQADWDYMY
eukprot:CAMPEP_0171339414 /NCGR_PEP_ID=MMETSP0878-20121228/7944_1 /TAXON_ID=67004 /ORGANISM="Thalassiosira weissflogii, Strain CCMP1336" /LENGTH=265 /DNA_ID=CAMNT_0011841337 /DNA_START=263 /DNA_END=1060 /DNA_ORIENTATION=-